MKRPEREPFKISEVKDVYTFLHNIKGCFGIKTGQIEVIQINLKDVEPRILNLLWKTIYREFTDEFITWGKINKLAAENGVQLRDTKRYTFITVCPECNHKYSVDDLKCPACGHNRNYPATKCHECKYIFQPGERVCPECLKRDKISRPQTAYLIRREE